MKKIITIVCLLAMTVNTLANKETKRPEGCNNLMVSNYILDVGDENLRYKCIPFTNDSQKNLCCVQCSVNGEPQNLYIDLKNDRPARISSEQATYMLGKRLINSEDIAVLKLREAGGFATGSVINIFEIKIGDFYLYNTEFVVDENLNVPLCIGNLLLDKLGNVEVDGKKEVLIVSPKREQQQFAVEGKGRIKATEETTQKEGEEVKVFDVVEQMPTFPGGLDALMQFVGNNMVYPIRAAKEGVQGRVIVQFIVEKDGTTGEAGIVHSVHPLLDAEALRIVSIMPKWFVGIQDGKPVRVKFTLPLTFRLN